MSDELVCNDQDFDETFPWRDFLLKNSWLGFGTVSMQNKVFKNKEMEKWAHRFEEIFHSESEIEECRQRSLFYPPVNKVAC